MRPELESELTLSRREAIGLAVLAVPTTAALLTAHPASAQAAELNELAAAKAVGEAATATGKASVTYRARLRKSGWQAWKKSGKTAGTVGKARALSSFAVKVETGGLSGTVKYCAHLSADGWQGWKKSGKAAGKSSRNLEAVRIKLTGELAKSYDVYYRAHIGTYGWLDWAKNGAIAGSTGMAIQMEALQVKLVKKGAKFKGKTAVPALSSRWQGIEFLYRDNPDVKHLLEVRYTGGSGANVVLRQKKGSAWRTVLSCQGYVGSAGIGQAREGLSRTPEGDFGITGAFGIEANPGAKLPYTQVTPAMYWCGDEAYYNQLIDINECPHYCTGEHLIDYSPHYNYGLFFDYNTNPVVLGAGSAFFFHCTGSAPYTEGCIAVAENYMVKILRTVTSGTRLCIYPA